MCKQRFFSTLSITKECAQGVPNTQKLSKCNECADIKKLSLLTWNALQNNKILFIFYLYLFCEDAIADSLRIHFKMPGEQEIYQGEKRMQFFLYKTGSEKMKFHLKANLFKMLYMRINTD